MKHASAFCLPLLIAALLLTFAACGADQEPAPTSTPVETSEPTPAPTSTPETPSTPEVTPTPVPAATPAPTPAPDTQTTPVSDADPKATAQGLVGSDISALYAAVGYPTSSSYAPSCLGEGEDGELLYDGFTVYTYRENGVETIQTVL